MIAALIALVATVPTMPAPPGDGLGLAPQPVAVTPTIAPPPAPAAPAPGMEQGPGPGTRRPVLPPPWSRFFIGAVVSLLAAEAALRRRRGDVGPVPPPNVDVVLVSGHGTSPTGNFEDLVAQMGLHPGQVHVFDWGTALPGFGYRAASQWADVDQAAAAVAALVSSVERPGRFVYLIGHSKGGAALAHLIAHWDRHPEDRPGRVVGAALLDPPISAGWGGLAQSLGLVVGWVPDDGGYDPKRPIAWGLLGYEDTRVRLGERSGIEVVAIRNPDALVTNFRDEPDGLRIYDLDDRGPHPLLSWPNPAARIIEAHNSVLRHPAVALCLVGELWRAGGCVWTGGPPRPPGPVIWGRHGLAELL